MAAATIIAVEQEEVEEALLALAHLLDVVAGAGNALAAECALAAARKIAFILPADHPLRQPTLDMLDALADEALADEALAAGTGDAPARVAALLNQITTYVAARP